MTLEDLLAAVSAELGAIGYRVPMTLAVDQEGARFFFDAGTEIQPTGRRLFLRCAATFLGCAVEARVGGDLAVASRWAERAEAELDRYREPAPELQPYFIASGGAS
jgi:hypothetical protein